MGSAFALHLAGLGMNPGTTYGGKREKKVRKRGKIRKVKRESKRKVLMGIKRIITQRKK